MINVYDPKTGTCTDGRVTWLADSAHVELHRRLMVLANAVVKDCEGGHGNCGACDLASEVKKSC